MGTSRRQRRSSGLRLSVGALVLALLAAACAGGDGEGGGDGEATDTSGGGTETTAAGEPVRGGTLTYGLEAESSQGYSMPTANCATSCYLVAYAIFDPLTYPDENGEIKPFLAESIEPNADHTEYTIKARPGISFHNGEPFNADAIKANLDAHKASGLTGPALAPMQSVAKVDDMTVRVTMSAPWPAFPAYMSAQTGLQNAPAQLADKTNGPRNPIGTGPFKFREWVVDDHLTVVRNENYWREGLPYLDEIVYRPIPDIQARRAALESGDVDVMHTSNGDEIGKLRDVDGVELVESDDFGDIGYIMLNVEKPPLNDVRVRRALALATNQDEVNQLRNGGVTAVADGPFPEGSLGYLEDTGYPDFDLEEATRLVREYEAENGPIRFEFGTTTDPFNLGTNQLVQQQWAKAGIETDLVQVEQQKYIGQALVGAFDAYAWRSHAGVDPDQQFIWWHSALASPQGQLALNFGRIKDPEIDQALVTIRTNPDEAARKEAAEAVNREFGKDVYNVWLWHTVWGMAHTPEVKNLTDLELPDGGGKVSPAIAGRHFLSQAYVDPDS